MRLPESRRLAVCPPKTFFVAGSGAVVARTGRVLQRADGDTVRQNRNMNSKQGDAKQWRQHRLHRCTTGFWSGALKRAKASVAGSSSRIPQKRSRTKTTRSPSARANLNTKAMYLLST